MKTESGDGLAVYVHWPFCQSKCPYCDFNSHVAETAEALDPSRWARAYEAEIAYFAERTPGRTVTSIYFGGGTPSLMAPAVAGRVIEAIAANWSLAADAEINLEANPSSAEAAAFAELAAAGVNRLSLGVQSLEESGLRALGRVHDVAQARAALAAAKAVFPRVSFDLIYARPDHDAAAWGRELAAALDLAAGHLSLYELTIEPGTPFHALRRQGGLDLPGEDDSVAMYETTQELTGAAGLPAYEISNHAAAGQESRHNLAYWRYGEYAGIGPGAHGRLNLDGALHALEQVRRPAHWLDAVEATGHGIAKSETLDPATRATEMLVMGLRTAEGVSEARFRRVTGGCIAEHTGRERLEELIADGLLISGGGRLSATARGRSVLNSLLARLCGG